MGKQLTEGVLYAYALEICQQHVQIGGTELGKHLQTQGARRSRRASIRDNDKQLKIGIVCISEGTEHSMPFGADRGTVACILNIATGEH
jgi:hypothetical protein